MQKRQRNQRGEGAQLKVEIMEAAMRLLDRKPGAQLSLRNVAQEAGIAPPSIYAHFQDARAMTAEVVRECWRQMAEVMEHATEANQDASGFDKLSRKMSAFVRYAMERPSRYQLLFALDPIDPIEEARDLPGLLQPAYRSVIACIEQIVRDGDPLPTEDTVSAALLTLSLVHGRIALAHLSPLRTGNSAESVDAFISRTLQQIFSPIR